MTINKRKIILGCLGIVALCCCAWFAFVVYLVSTMSWDTVVRNNMHDAEFRGKIEKWIGFEFPDSAEWEKSEYRVWQDADFDCVFTLPRKDIDLMFPPEKVTWQENDHAMLPRSWKEWLKEKKLDHFKVMKYKLEPQKRYVTVVVENPPGTDENQRVWVYLSFFET